jgi:predicted DsbA family dithiol-disulfide isomerase
MVSRIMRAYWAEGRDIGEVATLVDLAAQIGLDPAGTERLFRTGADIEDIRSREAHSRQRGVNAVPTFIIAGKYVVQGAQPTELWLDVIDDLRSQASGTAP